MWPRVDGMRSLALGTPGEMRQRLNGLVRSGAKRATAGLLTEYAEEGEGDTSLDEWRAGHLRYWANLGQTVTDDTEIVCIRFRLVS